MSWGRPVADPFAQEAQAGANVVPMVSMRCGAIPYPGHGFTDIRMIDEYRLTIEWTPRDRRTARSVGVTATALSRGKARARG